MENSESKVGFLCQVTAVVSAVMCGLLGLVLMITTGFLTGLLVWISGFVGFLVLYALGDTLCLAHENRAAMAEAMPLLRELVEWQKAGIVKPLPHAEEPAPAVNPPYEDGTQQEVVTGDIAYDQPEEQVAHFNRMRVGDQIMCPFCARLQKSDRKRCFGCGAKFVMDN